MNEAVSGQLHSGKIDRSFVNIAPGEVACYQKEVFRITQVLDFKRCSRSMLKPGNRR